MALINQKAHIELPSEWADQIAVARSKPSPFIVEQCKQDLFRNWADYFKHMFKPKCPIPTHSIKEIRVHREKPKLIFHRDSYNGAWVSNVITNNRYKGPILQANQFTHPQKLYDSLLPISAAKYDDCMDLHYNEFSAKTIQYRGVHVLLANGTLKLCAAAVSLLCGRIGRSSGREIACSALSLARSAQAERDNESRFFVRAAGVH
ncbi:hypothetical protein EVAR_27093_1 [Eumeta japonica]|uniref:Uncharacterized protein n=1 Tax=Eumeta variegata TaxID=151549 RepID=A0A4C1VKK8_EUMVA|nr:hypothetical protein EVAR_27093_1 [Eumeta japonica]